METTLNIVLRFETESPEGDWFLGERLWAPIMGYGMEAYFEGFNSCSPFLNVPGCPYDDTMMMDVRIDQPGANYTNYDLSDPEDPNLDYVRLRSNPVCGAIDRDGIYAIGRRQEPLSFTDIGAFIYDIPGLLLRGKDQEGHPVSVEFVLTFRGFVFYEWELVSFDFREPNWLQLPWIAIYGRRVEL